ncbi:endoglucanase 4-like [Patiria miniata]|uniref:cellulase n=1 Tax=Patiria miniata TaxID=46514 RepID=A0A914A0A9_PATMI|nr:endoglucanase 4-like [Patiria miniata]
MLRTMLMCVGFLLVYFSLADAACYTCGSTTNIRNQWPGNFDAEFSIPITNSVSGGWKLKLQFSKPVTSLQIWKANIKNTNGDSTLYILENKRWNRNLSPGQNLAMSFLGQFDGQAPSFTVRLLGQADCGQCSDSAVIHTTPRPAVSTPLGCRTCCSSAQITHEWPGNFNGEFILPIENEVTGGWEVELLFSEPVSNLQVYNALITDILNGGTIYRLRNKNYNADLAAGTVNTQRFQASTTVTPSFTAHMVGQPECCQDDPTSCQTSTTVSPPTTEPSTELPTELSSEPRTVPSTRLPITAHTTTAVKPVETTRVTQWTSSAPYDYAEVIHKSILFYEAQRSGPLPPDNRIHWRSDSTLNDMGINGEDLTGGWFDAGDHVKFGFPMASTVTVLAWGLVEYRDAYLASGELDNMLDCIKWATDYFLKCHTGQYEFYGQVGDGNLDHAYWGRPEDMTMRRPAFKITAANPGTEVVAETAAALAASSIAFRQTDPTYAEELLQNAIELYAFADQYRGTYTNAIPNAASFYNSYSGYGDELAWSAAWLARATGNNTYLTAANKHYDAFHIGDGTPWAFSWDDKKAGVMMMMYQLTGATRYKTAITNYLNSWQPGNIQYTPKGLAWSVQWGTNRYAASTAFLALVAAHEGIEVRKYQDFAKQQINYMLGDGGRSFVVGFGNNPPHSPHHRASSCPDFPAHCGWSNLNDPDPNLHVLEGALVGGPDINDGFVNDRLDYIQNEVATDYNAGFQSALAGLKFLDMNGLY